VTTNLKVLQVDLRSSAMRGNPRGQVYWRPLRPLISPCIQPKRVSVSRSFSLILAAIAVFFEQNAFLHEV